MYGENGMFRRFPMRCLVRSIPAVAPTAEMALAEGGPGRHRHFRDHRDGNEDAAMTREERHEQRGGVFVGFDHDGNGVPDPAEHDGFDAARAGDLELQGSGKTPSNHPADLMSRETNDGDGDAGPRLRKLVDRTDSRFARMDATPTARRQPRISVPRGSRATAERGLRQYGAARGIPPRSRPSPAPRKPGPPATGSISAPGNRFD